MAKAKAKKSSDKAGDRKAAVKPVAKAPAAKSPASKSVVAKAAVAKPVAGKPLAAKPPVVKPGAVKPALAPALANAKAVDAKSPVARPGAKLAAPKSVAALTRPVAPASGKTSPTPGKANTTMSSRKPESGKPISGAAVPPTRPAVPARPGVAGRVPLSRSAVASRLAAREKEEKELEKNRLKKSPYSKRDLAPMRVALLAKRLQLVGAIDKLGNEALRADEPDTDSDDVADHGTDAFERNMTLGLMENEARTLQQIEEALEQMATGRYGVCTQCGTAIPLVRLEALPFATTCVPCQEKAERRM